MTTLLSELLVSVLLLLGAGFVFVGSYGLNKLGDLMARLHAPTKASTLGLGGILLASIVHSVLIEGELTANELLISIFIFIAAPVTAFMVAKAFIFRTRGETRPPLPPSGTERGWATLDAADRADDPPRPEATPRP